MDRPENLNTEDEDSQDAMALAIVLLLFTFEYEMIFGNFKNEVKFKSRYIPTDSTLSFFETIHPMLAEATVKLRKGTVLYRARTANADLKRRLIESLAESIFENYDADALRQSDNSVAESLFATLLGPNNLNIMDTTAFRERLKQEVFQGYQAKESGIAPAPNTPHGRLNPDRIPFLYTADSRSTAIYEIKPIIGETISVAKLKTNRPLRILDLTKDFPRLPYGNPPQNIKKSLLEVVADEFRRPNSGDPFSYIPTQYFSEFIRESEKLDGIRFWSSLKKGGKNIVFFQDEGCDVISSSLATVENIVMKISDF